MPQHAAFISYSHEDEQLAQTLKNLIDICMKALSYHFDAYLAAGELSKSGSQSDREDISEALAESLAFVPVLTRNSIHRPWVLYEAGIARGVGIPSHPVRTAAIGTVQLTPMLRGEYVYDLTKPEEIRELLGVLGRACHKQARPGEELLPSDEAMIDGTIAYALSEAEHAKLLTDVTSLAARRSVFIAGSTRGLPQKELSFKSYLKPRRTPAREYPNAACAIIARQLTRALIGGGFTVGSCPEVDRVGAAVALEAANYAQETDEENVRALSAYYRIGGIWWREPKWVTHYVRDPSLWEDVFKAFRISYLRDYDLLLLLGGSMGTYQEYEAANDPGLPIAITSIPFLGGTGRSIWSSLTPAWRIAPEDSEVWCLSDRPEESSAYAFVEKLSDTWTEILAHTPPQT